MSMSPIVHAPGSFAPAFAVSFGSLDSEATFCSPSQPLPVADRAFTAARALNVGTPVTPGRAVAVICSVAGTVSFRMAEAGILTVPVEAGMSVLPFSISGVEANGTTAVATYAVLD